MPWKTALENVAVALEPQGVKKPEALARARDWLGSVGLKGFADRHPHMLSGGQRKSVALAQMLIRDPALLMMDDQNGRTECRERVWQCVSKPVGGGSKKNKNHQHK